MILPLLTPRWRESDFIVSQPKLPENLLKLFWEVVVTFLNISIQKRFLFKLKREKEKCCFHGKFLLNYFQLIMLKGEIFTPDFTP